MKKNDGKTNDNFFKRFEPNSPVENKQSRVASINNENYNIQGQGDKDKM